MLNDTAVAHFTSSVGEDGSKIVRLHITCAPEFNDQDFDGSICNREDGSIAITLEITGRGKRAKVTLTEDDEPFMFRRVTSEDPSTMIFEAHFHDPDCVH